MGQQDCIWFTCLLPPPPAPSNDIFGFGDFIGAVALLIVFFQTVDFRYKFRLDVLPPFFLWILLALITFIGLGTLTMELWLQQGWPTPRSPITPSMWETIFALLFLGSFVSVTYFTFIRPPTFRRRNAKRFARALYRVLIKGNDAELAVVADELFRSSRSLVSLCATREERLKNANTPEDIAYDIFVMIANRKFCRHVVGSAQSTAISLCRNITELKRYHVPIGPFCTSVTLEAIENKDSILYHETQEFASDLIGNIRPWTKTIYGDYKMISAMGSSSPLEMRIWSSEFRWDVDKWTAFTRIVLAIIQGYADCDERYDWEDRNYSIASAIENLRWLTSRIYEDGGSKNFYDTDSYKKLYLAVDFVQDVVSILDNAKVAFDGDLKPLDKYARDIFQSVAACIYEIMMHASQVKSSRDVMWTVQHNTVWSSVFRMKTKSWKIIQARLIRLLYDEIVEMDKVSPNYRGIRVVGLVLNVLGLKSARRSGILPCERAIYKFASSWAKRNYLKLIDEYPEVAEAMLIGSLDFDSDKRRIRKTYASWLGKQGDQEYLELDEPERKVISQ